MKSIGIIGAGNIGKTVAAHLLKHNIPVLISNSRGPETLKETIQQLGAGATAVTTKEAAGADIVLLALPWARLKDLALTTDLKDKIVIDATNHFKPDYSVEDLGGKASSEIVQDYFPGARLVKAFNTLVNKMLAADPQVGAGRRVLFVAGDDAQAKIEISELITAIGFAPLDLGSLAVGSKYQQAKGTFSAINLIKI
jgi:predicted dinucleotide-binding enzyme